MSDTTVWQVGMMKRCDNSGCSEIGKVRELGGIPGKVYVHCPVCDEPDNPADVNPEFGVTEDTDEEITLRLPRLNIGGTILDD